MAFTKLAKVQLEVIVKIIPVCTGATAYVPWYGYTTACMVALAVAARVYFDQYDFNRLLPRFSDTIAPKHGSCFATCCPRLLSRQREAAQIHISP